MANPYPACIQIIIFSLSIEKENDVQIARVKRKETERKETYSIKHVVCAKFCIVCFYVCYLIRLSKPSMQGWYYCVESMQGLYYYPSFIDGETEAQKS